MGFLEVLTLIFIALKLMGYIDWTWLQVLSPAIIGGVIYIAVGFFILRKIKRMRGHNGRERREVYRGQMVR